MAEGRERREGERGKGKERGEVEKRALDRGFYKEEWQGIKRAVMGIDNCEMLEGNERLGNENKEVGWGGESIGLLILIKERGI